MKKLYECVVIGGGVAGSSAACYLAKLGYQVALLEKTSVAHHKVCGEFLSFEALKHLEEIGVHLGDESPSIKYFRLCTPRSRLKFTLPFSARGVSRFKLDQDLLINAERAGVEVMRNQWVRSYHHEANGIVRIETASGDFYAGHVFIATGKLDHCKEHKRVGKDNSYVGLKTHFYLKSQDQEFRETTALFTFRGGYGGISPIEGGRLNFCFLIDKKIYKAYHGNFDRVISYLCRSNNQLEVVLKQAEYSAPVFAISHIPYGFLRRESRRENVYFIGDQRMVIPSFTGDGMAIALSTAKACADEFDRGQKGRYLRGEKACLKLQEQMNWALTAHYFLKLSWMIDFCASIPGLIQRLVRFIFRKTRVSEMEEFDHAPRQTAIQNHYSRH